LGKDRQWSLKHVLDTCSTVRTCGITSLERNKSGDCVVEVMIDTYQLSFAASEASLEGVLICKIRQRKRRTGPDSCVKNAGMQSLNFGYFLALCWEGTRSGKRETMRYARCGRWRPRPGEKEGKRNDKAHAQHLSSPGRVTLSSTLAVTGPLCRRLST